MGGLNQSTCPPVSGSATPPKSAKSAAPATIAKNPIRFHEITSRGEVDFHDDKAEMKCAVDSAAFFDAYNRWRPAMTEDLILAGNNGSGGHASVALIPYVDDHGEMQVAMTVNQASMGQTIRDLDKLAHFS